ncbi:hypothetical protein PG990_013955 [Apiospora arundinis]
MPREAFTREIVERAPSHDNTRPCFSSWKFVYYPPDYEAQPSAQDRPKWSIQVYDTTVTAGDEAQIRDLARRIAVETRGSRYPMGDDASDRIDVYGLPMDAETPDEARFAMCIEHQKAERRARNATGSSDFYIPELRSDWVQTPRYFNRRILVVAAAATKDESEYSKDVGKDHESTLEDDHSYKEGPEGRLNFAIVEFDDRTNVTQLDPSPWFKDDWSELGGALMDFRESIEWFYTYYIPDGMMDEELRIAVDEELMIAAASSASAT